MITGLGAPTIREVDEMNAINVKDGEGPSTGSGAHTLVGRVMAKLENMASFAERGSLETSVIPFLFANIRTVQNDACNANTHLNNVVRMEAVDPGYAACAKELDPGAIETTVHGLLAAEFTTIFDVYSPAFEPYDLHKENLTVTFH